MQYHLALLIVLLSLAPLAASANEEPKIMPDIRIEEASKLMLDFARRTGLDSGRPPRRYLWTDAFAVCNFLGLARATREQHYRELALRLIDQVHHVLGKHREDDPRGGWISGLDEKEGEKHPTRGGLRIGKKLPERGESDPFDERLEWERDGQYFHYLTKWMHALDQASRVTGEPGFNMQARELAATAHDAFTYSLSPAHVPRMYWKMSIDLSRPLVPSMGQHDPLDGYITALQLRVIAASLPEPDSGPEFDEVIHRYGEMINMDNLASPDPLGIGGLLTDAYRVIQLIEQGETPGEDMPGHLLGAALAGLDHYARRGELQAPAEYRLAFRELGLAIGLHAVEQMQQMAEKNTTLINHTTRETLDKLMHYVPLAEKIESFWLDPGNQAAVTWMEHADINEVMLATSLAPEGYLLLFPVGGPGDE